MKKPLLTAVVLLSALALRAQTEDRAFKPFKVDVSLGVAVPQGGGSKSGGSGSSYTATSRNSYLGIKLGVCIGGGRLNY